MIEPYRYASGEPYGEEPPAPRKPRARLGTFAERARFAARRAVADPEWSSRPAESRRLLIDLDVREARGLR